MVPGGRDLTLRAFAFFLLTLLPFLSPPLTGSWIITLEEPTGIYRRDREVATVRMSFERGEARANALRAVDPQNRVLMTQVAVIESWDDGSMKNAEILFPASIIPGERPRYRIVNDASLSLPSDNTITARRIGISRVEMANERFGVIVNLGLEDTEPAILSAFNKSAADLHMLNLVETTSPLPEKADALEYGRRGTGFGTFLAKEKRGGYFNKVDILESGPLRAKVRLTGAKAGDRTESWEFVWFAGSPMLKWTASLDGASANSQYGFFVSSLAASPYMPFDKWIEGIELKFPDGWETDNPPDHVIGGKDFADLPGRHVVYYQRKENYGAIGFVELDPSLLWHGIGSHQFYASAPQPAQNTPIEIAIAFPNWKGTETVLEARKEYRKYTQPILAVGIRDSSATRSRPLSGQSRSAVTSEATNVNEVHRRFGERNRRSVSLDGQWRINWAEKSEGEVKGFHRADFDDKGWKLVKVPGTVHTQILEAPKFYTVEAEWISRKEWWYRRSFRAPPDAGSRQFLHFGATDYYADIYLNGKLLARHEGYIDPYDVEVTDKLIPQSDNQLTVRVWTPISYYWRHRPYTIKGSYGAVDQKPDNITPLGITRPLELRTLGRARIDEVAVDTRLNGDGSADVFVDLTIDSSATSPNSRIQLGLTSKNFDSAEAVLVTDVISLNSKQSRRRYLLKVAKPALWWTWDHGKPNLYNLDVSIDVDGKRSDQRRTTVGIREIEHVDWKFYLNGKRIYIRGTNYYYNLFQSEVHRADYERDMALIKSMNVNMVRLHCNFSNPEFYDLADELGILVWQDFLEAWYPEDTAFSVKAAGLYDPLIKYVRNHPSVAIWATSDEESLENYRDLTKHLEPRLYVKDPQRRPVQRSTGRYGDAHVYHGWYDGTIWEYAKMTERFVSELGATALPNYDSLMKFIPNAWPISEHEDEWVFRKLQIFEAMRAWGEPGNKTLKEYIPQTQDYVARLFQLAIERMRRIKYQPAGGILHFHAIDLWPSVTMAAIDFYRQPTKAFYTVQRSFQMVIPSIEYDRDTFKPGETITLPLWGINDRDVAIANTNFSWRLEDGKAKRIKSGRIEGPVTLEVDSSKRIGEITFKVDEAGKYTLWAEITDSSNRKISENCFEFAVVENKP